MTHAKILGPPRSGKKVLTEQEFFEQMSGYEKDADSDAQVVEPTLESNKQPAIAPTPSNGPSYFVAPGRFEIGGITPEKNTFIFHDLELPMGSWKELIVSRNYMSGSPTSIDCWTAVISNIGGALGKLNGLPPADIRYGLMAACYLKKSKKGLRGKIETIKYGMFVPDSKAPFAHNATIIHYSPGLVIPGAGWPQDHPFAYKYAIPAITGRCNFINKNSCAQDRTVSLALEEVLGENDPMRCKRVLEWAMDAKPAMLKRPFGTQDTRIVLFDVREEACFTIDESPKSQCHARLLHADPDHYERK